MSAKTYKLRSLTLTQGQNTLVDLNLEFEGKRAFIIWDSVPVGQFELKARLEIDPKRLRKASAQGWDYYYSGPLVLPRPEHN